MDNDLFEKGLAKRKDTLGAEYVERHVQFLSQRHNVEPIQRGDGLCSLILNGQTFFVARAQVGC